MENDRGRQQLDVWSLLGLGGYDALCIAGGIGLGLFLDHRLHTSPALLLVGLFVGIVLAVVGSVFQIRKYLR